IESKSAYDFAQPAAVMFYVDIDAMPPTGLYTFRSRIIDRNGSVDEGARWYAEGDYDRYVEGVTKDFWNGIDKGAVLGESRHMQVFIPPSDFRWKVTGVRTFDDTRNEANNYPACSTRYLDFRTGYATADLYLYWVAVRKYASQEPSASFGNEESRHPTSANITSTQVTPSPIASWDKFYANDNISAQGTNITYKILNASDNSTKCAITESEAGSGYDISTCASGLSSIRLFANLTTTNTSNTPILYDWNVSWDPHPPNKPQLNSPDNATFINTIYTLLNWTCTDPDGDTMTAYVYGGNTTNPTTLINTTTNCQSGSSYTFNWTGLNETTYYWKVTCNDGFVANTSDDYQFTIDTTTPILNFTSPTEPNNTYVSRNWTEAKIEIDEPNLHTFKFNWNNSNYTFYDDSLVLGLNFNNNSAIGETSTYAVDISKYGNNGTFYGNATWTTEGKFGGAMEFDGEDDYVDCGN
ncbi:MAG: hypothetical protein KAU95_01855, partial [Candidatus Aenigmarchaeota archaeon]|nr:hypothetical protein [Candidatus Aenigmarchaeota archaeon]